MSYPLLFEPVYMEKLWGGRRLLELRESLPAGLIGESWDVSAYPAGISVVENGPFKGKTLPALCSEYPQEIFGTKEKSEFPLLIKFIDAHQDLSVQVHPKDEQARVELKEAGKTEMWVIVKAVPGAQIVYGLKEGTTRSDLAKAIQENQIEAYLNWVEVQEGDVFFLPAGLVHALGAGVLVAEVQQSSDTVFRLFDWNRVDASGQPREIHVERALKVIDYGTPLPEKGRESRVSCPYFVVDWLKEEYTRHYSMSRGFHVLMNLGPDTLVSAKMDVELPYGRCCLLPACLGEFTLKDKHKVLSIYLP